MASHCGAIRVFTKPCAARDRERRGWHTQDMVTSNERVRSDPAGARLTVGDVVEIVIEKLAHGGEGLARVAGRVMFVPLAAPGDRASVRIVEIARSHARGEIVEILSPSPDRRAPPCRYFGACGGCQLQHLEYRAQLATKARIVHEALEHIGGIRWPSDIPMLSAGELGYRSRCELKISSATEGETRVGYFRAHSHEVVDVEECPILEARAAHELTRLRSTASRLPRGVTRAWLASGDEEGVLVTDDAGDRDCAGSDRTVHQRVGGIDYRFGLTSFFQCNRLLVEDLVRTAVGETSGVHAADLYAGAGLFSLPLARRFLRVQAVEENATAVKLLEANALDNHIDNLQAFSTRVEDWLAREATLSPPLDFVLLDPPRRGAGVRVIEVLQTLHPRAIAYVSCDPATLARDLRHLVACGYALDAVTALDMFPQTAHVEAVAQLSLAAVS